MCISVVIPIHSHSICIFRIVTIVVNYCYVQYNHAPSIWSTTIQNFIVRWQTSVNALLPLIRLLSQTPSLRDFRFAIMAPLQTQSIDYFLAVLIYLIVDTSPQICGLNISQSFAVKVLFAAKT